MPSQDKSCLKCGYTRTPADRAAPGYACPRCRAVYAKVEEARRALLVADTVPSTFNDRPLRGAAPDEGQPTGLRGLLRAILGRRAR